MGDGRCGLAAATALLVAAVGCGAGADGISERAAVETAARALMGKPGFDRNVPTRVTRSADTYRVQFHFPVPDGEEGETYHSFAIVDARSGEVLELGVEQDLAAGARTPVPHEEPRPTALREEVDEVGDLQRRLVR